MSLTPPIGASGIFKLAPPFQALLNSGVSYSCQAVRRMSDILKLGIDPYGQYYAPYGLARSLYDADLAADQAIVSLRSNGGHWVYVPTSYIASYPNMGGIPYKALVLAINIGPVPDYLDLNPVKSKIRAVVQEMVGVSSEVQSVAISETKNMVQADHNAIEAARQANITNTTTDYARYLEAKAQRDALTLRVQQLEAYIREHMPPP